MRKRQIYEKERVNGYMFSRNHLKLIYFIDFYEE